MRLWKRLVNAIGEFGARSVLVMLVFAMVASTCIVRLVDVQLVNAKTYAQAAADTRTASMTIKANRGKIEDTNGTVLAQSVERYDIIGDAILAQQFKPVNCT